LYLCYSQEIEKFDAHGKKILIYYLDYLCQWVLLLLRDKSGGGLSGRKGGTGQEKSLLDDEWAFIRENCSHIRGGESVAARRFCFLASNVLDAVGEGLEQVRAFHISIYLRLI
jgi:hypothetical protein